MLLGNLLLLLFFASSVTCEKRVGADPWQVSNSPLYPQKGNSPEHTGADSLQESNAALAQKGYSPESATNLDVNAIETCSTSHYFFKRLLAVILKGGQTTLNEDRTRNIHIHLHLNEEQWSELDGYSQKDTLMDNQYRSVIGCVSDGLYKPTLTEKISMAWNQYVQYYLNAYKVEILWSLTGLILIFSIKHLAKHATKRLIFTLVFINLYLYESYVSFKEAEKKEHEKFVQALSACQWTFWSSRCDLPMPDPLVMLKHMHPGRILMRLVSIVVTEPIVAVSGTVNTVCDTIGESMGVPYFGQYLIGAILKVLLNIVLISLIIMVILTFILNIPFNISFIGGLVSLGTSYRQSSTPYSNHITSNNPHNNDRISGPNLRKLLDIIAFKNEPEQIGKLKSRTPRPIRRSQSASRVQDLVDGRSPKLSIMDSTQRKMRKGVPLFKLGGGDS